MNCYVEFVLYDVVLCVVIVVVVDMLCGDFVFGSVVCQFVFGFFVLVFVDCFVFGFL